MTNETTRQRDKDSAIDESRVAQHMNISRRCLMNEALSQTLRHFFRIAREELTGSPSVFQQTELVRAQFAPSLVVDYS